MTNDSLRWYKSSYSNNGGSCVEVALDPVWVKSTHSDNGGTCVEWAPGHAATTGAVPVRDSTSSSRVPCQRVSSRSQTRH
ncbi:DUF397 domain-containing protein, partial [Streptomyces halstedii]|uniref:DUF397 domain-containing protein n=1 Tax=Streptomyces halstedii TaxID=1944 RepID=UPI003460F2D6